MAENTRVSRPRSALTNMLSAPALRYRGFRLLWLSTVFSSWGFMGEMVILGWVTQVLTDDTFKVGVVLGVRMVPFFLLGVPAGAVADRFDRRHMVSVVNIAMAALIAALGLLIMREMVDVWLLAAFGFAGGCLRAVNMPARQSLAYDIVGGGNVVNGIALMSMGMRVGAIAGSLSAGYIMAWVGEDAACRGPGRRLRAVRHHHHVHPRPGAGGLRSSGNPCGQTSRGSGASCGTIAHCRRWSCCLLWRRYLGSHTRC